MTKKEILQKLHEKKFIKDRMISGSKTRYHDLYPNNLVFFNANIITPDHGKIWYGDLDITIDGEQLKKIAVECQTIFYILKELDAKFEKEEQSISDFIKRAVWDTTQKVISVKEYRERNS